MKAPIRLDAQGAESWAGLPRFFAPALEDGAGVDAAGSMPMAGPGSVVYVVLGQDALHMRDVLRLSAGERFILCDSHGVDYLYAVTGYAERPPVARKRGRLCAAEAWAELVGSRPSPGEPSVRIAIWQCMPKGDKFDSVVQKCVETGASEITPVVSRRVDYAGGRFEGGVVQGKIERWNRIALEAAKQCGRGEVPRVKAAVAFEEAVRACGSRGLAEGAPSLALMPYELCKEPPLRASLRAFFDGVKTGSGIPRVDFIIGPEGGFDPGEAKRAEECGVRAVSLGPRILRTETAGQACAFAVVYERET